MGKLWNIHSIMEWHGVIKRVKKDLLSPNSKGCLYSLAEVKKKTRCRNNRNSFGLDGKQDATIAQPVWKVLGSFLQSYA